MIDDALPLNPGLYVTATPIGNLGDMTYRAVAVMKAADLILCEDTRQTAKLCSAYDIKTSRMVYQDHNAARVRPEILKRLKDGAAICLVSDAGTPLIADPGYKLVREARDEEIDVFPVPGASAVTAAISAAGAPSDRFSFGGFPPPKKTARQNFFRTFSETPGLLVFYETGNRLAASLEDMHAVLGERTCVIARELTKIHESFERGVLSAIAEQFAPEAPKGEIVVLIFPKPAEQPGEDEVDAFLTDALKRMSVREASASAAAVLNIPKRQAYARALALKDDT